MKWLASALIASVILPCALQAKGLDKLQPDTEEPVKDDDAKEGRSSGAKGEGKAAVGGGLEKDKLKEKEKEKDKEKTETVLGPKKEGEEKELSKAEVKEPEVPVEPGFQGFYVSSSLSFIDISGSSGTWHSSSTGDLEAGYRLLKGYRERWDIYGTLRYRPADVTAEKDYRAYRGVTQSYLFGTKAQTEIGAKLFGVLSAELGRTVAELRPIDGGIHVDASLEKSGVDLSLGGGVSYLVLDKIALGTQIHLGFGAYKSTQIGVDLRFLL